MHFSSRASLAPKGHESLEESGGNQRITQSRAAAAAARYLHTKLLYNNPVVVVLLFAQLLTSPALAADAAEVGT